MNSSYISSVGDNSFNFAYNDFTVEFFVSPSNNNGCQTLFEITNNESAAANLYTKTRFLTVIENGNLNTYAIQTTVPFFVAGNTSVFTAPTTITATDKVFYNGIFLSSNQYSISQNIITLSNVTLNSGNTLVEVGPILFQVEGNPITSGNVHFVSAERYQGQFYLYLDGQLQKTPTAAYCAIPTQVLSNTTSNSNILRFDSPALLTIGANRDGQNPFFGKFGDIKIINGTAQHVQQVVAKDSIYSYFTDYNLGTQNSAIIVDGSNFVDNITSYSPEEYVNGQLFDTLCIQVFQQSTANASANILAFSLFKPSILIGPIGEYNFVSTSSSNIITPWTSLDAAAASVLVNGNALPSNEWSITNGFLTVNATSNSNIEIIATGPTNYYDMSNSFISTLTTNLYSTDTIINVANVSNFITPYLSTTQTTSNNLVNVRGQIFINQECITYLYANTVANTLSGLMRGTSGTGVPNVHLSGARVISASYNNDLQNLSGIDPRIASWYTYPLANTSLENTKSIISNVLVTFGGLPPATPF